MVSIKSFPQRGTKRNCGSRLDGMLTIVGDKVIVGNGDKVVLVFLVMAIALPIDGEKSERFPFLVEQTGIGYSAVMDYITVFGCEFVKLAVDVEVYERAEGCRGDAWDEDVGCIGIVSVNRKYAWRRGTTCKDSQYRQQ